MQPFVTDGVAWSVGRSVGRSVGLSEILSPARNGWTIKMLFGVWTRVRPRNHVLDGVQIPPCEGAFLRWKTLSAWQMAGWKSKLTNSSTVEPELWRNVRSSAFQLQETTLIIDKIWCTCLVINRISLQTFWTPLVSAAWLWSWPYCNFTRVVQMH